MSSRAGADAVFDACGRGRAVLAWNLLADLIPAVWIGDEQTLMMRRLTEHRSGLGPSGGGRGLSRPPPTSPLYTQSRPTLGRDLAFASIIRAITTYRPAASVRPLTRPRNGVALRPALPRARKTPTLV